MSDLISRADAICEVLVNDGIDNIVDRINALPSAELTLQTPQTYGKSINPSNAEVAEDLISRADAIEAVRKCVVESELLADWNKAMESAQELLSALPSADAVSREVYDKRTQADEEIIDSYRQEFQKALSTDAEPKMTEEVREALMRLTMCAREECGMCKYKDKCGFEFQYNISTENMNTILEALSADAVSREALNGVKFVAIKGDKVEEAYRSGWNSAIECIIENAPSADAKQGEWIEKYNGNGWNDFWDYTCSNCGKKYERADAVLYHANYCPNCGAKMKGGAE